MCRYGITAYKPHYACFECRKTFKRRLLVDVDKDSAYNSAHENQPYKCPECGGLTANMGLDFESPKKTDVKAWNHIQSLFEAGITFHSCGCSGPGYIPKDQESLIEFLKEKRAIYIENRRFWSTRIEPKGDSEKRKDWDENNAHFFNIPNDLKTGTKKNRKVDAEKAVAYWTEKIDFIQSRLQKAGVVFN